MIYDSIPQIGPDKAKGAVAEIDPRQGTLVRMLPVANCHPAGLVGGPGDNLLLGCGAGDKEGGLPPLTVVIDARSGAVVKEIPGIGASDMVAYDRGLGLYYTASRNMPGGPKLGVIDAKANALVQAVELPGGNPHSVAVERDQPPRLRAARGQGRRLRRLYRGIRAAVAADRYFRRKRSSETISALPSPRCSAEAAAGAGPGSRVALSPSAPGALPAGRAGA